MEDKLQFLQKVYLFKDIPESCIRELLKAMRIEGYPKGEEIIREGELGDSLFILFEGTVSVTKKLTLFADNQGKSRVDKALIRLKGSDYAFFGEMSLCGEAEERSATVKAATDCVLGELAAEDIYRMVEEKQDFGRKFYQNLAKVLADRLRKANRDILKLTTVLTLALEE
ncbi:hypothetical protein B1H10_04510 [candidate division KSB1 bacterium 4484_188]|nr:MAG: hypothetical protein B1H10_04510 [candidate division KSB1 bacterium 4484_188]HFE64855.1 cyclic nucleotide-binding domain-containing protein [Caldithrix sp.]